MCCETRPFLVSLLFLFGCQQKENRAVRSNSQDTVPHARIIHRILVKGKVIDNETRCTHYHTRTDIIAIKFKCCNTYYPCYSCHKETAAHEPMTWEVDERDTKAILCGVCGHELTITEYMASNFTCPACRSAFNPNCRKHYDLYFTME